MSHRRHVTVDVDTENSRRLDWAHGVRTDLDVGAWNVVATTDRCKPGARFTKNLKINLG